MLSLKAGTAAFTEGEWLGHKGAVDFVANQMEVLEGLRMEIDEIIDGDGRLVVLIRFGGHARHTGIHVEASPAHVFDLRDGKAGGSGERA